MKIFTFDTTLRDGTQGESISFSVDDKLIIAQKLDELDARRALLRAAPALPVQADSRAAPSF